jgi:hypothetical protein
MRAADDADRFQFWMFAATLTLYLFVGSAYLLEQTRSGGEAFLLSLVLLPVTFAPLFLVAWSFRSASASFPSARARGRRRCRIQVVVLAVTGFLVVVSTPSALNWLLYVRDRHPIQAQVTDVQARELDESGSTPTHVYRLTDTATGRDMGWAVGERNADRGPSQLRPGDLVESYSFGDDIVLAEHTRSGRAVFLIFAGALLTETGLTVLVSAWTFLPSARRRR